MGANDHRQQAEEKGTILLAVVTVSDTRTPETDVSGQLIREFDLIDDPSALESGALRIGWNKILWDGRDEDGDEVGTGVYLYRVFASAEDESVHTGDDCSGDPTCRTASAPIGKVVVIR